MENQALDSGFIEKTMLRFDEAVSYTGFSKSHLYKLTSTRVIPHYKPNGKNIFFDKAELDKWLHGNRIATSDELDKAAADYCRSRR